MYKLPAQTISGNSCASMAGGSEKQRFSRKINGVHNILTSVVPYNGKIKRALLKLTSYPVLSIYLAIKFLFSNCSSLSGCNKMFIGRNTAIITGHDGIC